MVEQGTHKPRVAGSIPATATFPIGLTSTMIQPRQILPQEKIADHYNELDPFYREIWGEHLHHGLWQTGKESPEEAQEKMIQLLANKIQLKTHETVCDVGCGYGATARYLAREYGARVTGLTLSQKQFHFASVQDVCEPKPEYYLRDWYENGFESRAFDAVIAMESLGHMGDKPLFLEEVKRVLKPGGRFAFLCWQACEQPRPWQVTFLLEPIVRGGSLLAMGSMSEYRDLIQASGLKLEGYLDISSQVKRTWSICVLRLLKKIFTDSKYVRYLLDSRQSNRIFAVTLLRIWLAYQLRSLRLGVAWGSKS